MTQDTPLTLEVLEHLADKAQDGTGFLQVDTATALDLIALARAHIEGEKERACTCHPDDRDRYSLRPCFRKYALTDCINAAYERAAVVAETFVSANPRLRENETMKPTMWGPSPNIDDGEPTGPELTPSYTELVERLDYCRDQAKRNASTATEFDASTWRYASDVFGQAAAVIKRLAGEVERLGGEPEPLEEMIPEAQRYVSDLAQAKATIAKLKTLLHDAEPKYGMTAKEHNDWDNRRRAALKDD